MTLLMISDTVCDMSVKKTSFELYEEFKEIKSLNLHFSLIDFY